MITPSQCRGARAMLKMKLPDLSEAAGISVSTINSFELERRQPTKANLSAIQRALEAAGVRFTERGVEIADTQEKTS